MLLNILFLTPILSILAAFSLASEGSGFDPTCQSHFTQGYGYRLFFHLPTSSFLKDGSIQFNFSLSGPSDGHVLLSEKPSTYPAYEIVLGAGMNEFSEIRKFVSSKFEGKASQLTKKILSPDEIRNFSISINSGLIAVTSMKNNQPGITFLSWRDAAPLDVKYVSFCAWTGVTVTWYYDCKGAMLVPETVSKLQKLKHRLLANYDTYSIPIQDDNKLMIDTTIGIHYINLDVKKSILTTHGKFNFTWVDYRIKWDPKEYDNITSVNFLHREVWLPEFTLFNSVDSVSSPMGKSVTRITHNGLVSWWPDAEIKTWCTVDLKEWPFDTQSCNVGLGLYSHPEAVQVSLSKLQENVILKHLEWKIVSVTGRTTTFLNPWVYNNTDENESQKVLMLNIELQRQSQLYVWSFFAPIIGSIFIIIGSFLLPILCVKRLLLHSVAFLVLLLNLLSLGKALPALPSSTPHIMSVTSGLLFLTTIHIIFATCLMKTTKLYKSVPPKFVTRVITNPVLQRLFCIFGDYQVNDDEISVLSDEDKFNTQQTNPWILFSIVLDRILFDLTTLFIFLIFIF